MYRRNTMDYTTLPERIDVYLSKHATKDSYHWQGRSVIMPSGSGKSYYVESVQKKVEWLDADPIMWAVGAMPPPKGKDRSGLTWEKDADEIMKRHGFKKLTEGGIEYNILSYKTMKEKWYNAIRKNRHGDFEAFGYFTDVTTIGESAFEWDSLESIEIPKSVITIGAKAFADNNLTSVNIPDSVEYIGSEAFAGQGSMSYRVNGLTSVRIPDSVKYIGEGAFEENVITSLILPKSLKFIAPDAFRRNQLESIKIPATVKFIGEGAFKDNKLTSVIIPDSVQLIESDAFSANKLTSVSVAKSTKIGYKAFDENVKIIRGKKRSASPSGGAGSSSKKRRMELMQMQLKTSLKF